MSDISFEEMYRWRDNLKELLIETAELRRCKIHVINPCDYYNFKEQRHQSESEVMDFDINHVITSDLIVVNVEGLKTSDGTKIELYEAWCQGIPIIAFDVCGVYAGLHPWVKRCITRVENNMNDVVRYIADFYML